MSSWLRSQLCRSSPGSPRCVRVGCGQGAPSQRPLLPISVLQTGTSLTRPTLHPDLGEIPPASSLRSPGDECPAGGAGCSPTPCPAHCPQGPPGASSWRLNAAEVINLLPGIYHPCIPRLARGEGRSPTSRTAAEKPPAHCSRVGVPPNRCPDTSPLYGHLLVSCFSPSSPQPEIKRPPLPCPTTGKAATDTAARGLLLCQGSWQSQGWGLGVQTWILEGISCLPEQGWCGWEHPSLHIGGSWWRVVHPAARFIASLHLLAPHYSLPSMET